MKTEVQTEEPGTIAHIDAPVQPPRPAQPSKASLRRRLAGPAIGALLFALYIVLLANKDLGAVPGGWKTVAGVIVLAIVGVAAAALVAGRPRSLTLGRMTTWAAAHATLLTISGITLGALALRVFGISDNLPYINSPDEPAVADRALAILQTGDYNPHYFVYPNLYTYMQAAVYFVRFFMLVSSGTVANIGSAAPTDFYLVGRLLTALLGTLTVPLVYWTGRRLYGTAVGLVAAAFMATNSVHITHSQLIGTDVPATFFSALALVAIVRLLPGKNNRQIDGRAGGGAMPSVGRYLLAGAALGLAIGTKYNSALVVLPFIIAHIYAADASSANRSDKLRHMVGGRLWLGLGAAIVAFLATTPFAILDLPNFLNDVASVITHYRFGHTGHEGDDNWLYYAGSFLSTDFLPTLLTLIGVALAFVRHRRADILLLAFPVSFYFTASAYRVNFERNMLPILPFTSILAALPLVLLWRYLIAWGRRTKDEGRKAEAAGTSVLRPSSFVSLRASRALLAAAVAVAVLPATVAAAQRGYRQTQPDDRVRAVDWLNANTRPGTKLWIESSGPVLPPGRYIAGSGDHVTDYPLDWYVANRYDYLVVSSGAYKSVVYDQPESNPPLRDAYLRFFADNQARLAASFIGNKIDHPGPDISIYRTGYTPPQKPSDVTAQHPLSAVYQEGGANGAQIRLLGADYPDTVAAGTGLPLTLYWSADKPPAQDYTVFIHFTDSKGNRQAQRDTAPQSNTSPTSQWKAGEVVVDEAPLDLPAGLAPGTYMLAIGLYVQSNGSALPPLPVTGGPTGSGGDYVALGPVTVTPAAGASK